MAGGVGTMTQEQPLGLEHQLQELLPGIPNEITLNHITTKLPWTGVCILPSLSRAWNRAIQSRQVHCARVQSHSTETLVFVTGSEFNALYSMRAREFYLLPSFPGLYRRVDCRCVSVDGRVYILGAREHNLYHIASDSVYVVELVGPRKWTKLANVPKPFDAVDAEWGSVGGKIYVFGLRGHKFSLMVYDPKVDAWSSITPIPDLRRDKDMAVVGGELFLHSVHRKIYGPHGPLLLHIYNPIRNEWREAKTGAMDKLEHTQVFVADGKFYVMTDIDIHRLETEKNTWTEVHSFSYAAILGLWDDEILTPVTGMGPISVLAANGELLAIVSCSRALPDGVVDTKICVLQSKGFGGENNVILWEKVNGPGYLAESYCLCPVEL